MTTSQESVIDTFPFLRATVYVLVPFQVHSDHTTYVYGSDNTRHTTYTDGTEVRGTPCNIGRNLFSYPPTASKAPPTAPTASLTALTAPPAHSGHSSPCPQTLQFPSGQRETRRPDGSQEIHFPDGSRKTCDAQGTEQLVTTDGITICTNQLGEKVRPGPGTHEAAGNFMASGD